MNPGEHQPIATWRIITAGLLTAGALGGGALMESRDDNAVQDRINQLEASSLAEQKVNDRVARYLGALSGSSGETVAGIGLKDVSELPGYGQTVNPEARKTFEKSTLKIVMQPKASEYNYLMPNCTAAKVLVGGEPRVLTARHCFQDQDIRFVTSGKGGYIPGETNEYHDYANITEVALNNYGVALPGDSLVSDATISFANAVVEDMTGSTDWALLKIKPGNAYYDDMPAIEIDSIVHADPTPGEEVALKGLPAANGNDAVVTTGIYLGNLNRTDYPNQVMDYVGIDAKDAASDACNFGASGSVGLFASGGHTGPLALRNTLGYGNDMLVVAPDNGEYGAKERLRLEEELGIDLSKFTTICAFSRPGYQTVEQLEEQIKNPTEIALLETASPYPAKG